MTKNAERSEKVCAMAQNMGKFFDGAVQGSGGGAGGEQVTVEGSKARSLRLSRVAGHYPGNHG